MPDIVVVVMDCVQAKEFDRVVEAGNNPLSGLRAEAVTFPRAASVAPWTLPSHASLFSGLYPWEHGCHGKGLLQFSPQITRIPQWLKSLGYRTYSVSGNPIIGANYGFLDGFDRAAWGEWWERAYRILETAPNIYRDTSSPPRNWAAPSLRRRLARTFTTAAQRAPYALAANNALLSRLRGLDPEIVGSLNPWIEPTLHEWLRGARGDPPFFCFVNYIDAHEPYLTPGNGDEGARLWWRSLRIPQDSLELLSGRVPLNPEDSELLRRMYRQSIRMLVGRVGRLVQFLKTLGRWDDTLFILTSDHGQAFGEGGVVWHGLRPDEEELRVPLWVKLPGGARPVGEGVGWASPLDVAGTVMQATGHPRPELVHSIPLQDLAVRVRPAPLLAVSDGVTWNAPLCARLPSSRVAQLDQIYGVGYEGNAKAVVNVTAEASEAYDLTADPGCRSNLWPLERLRFEALMTRAREAAVALLKSPTPTRTPAEDRLHSWGYM